MRRREIEIRTEFAPTRSSALYLRAAYEAVSPVVERSVVGASPPAVIEERDNETAATPRRPRAGASR
jgi:hypothetical protein